MNKENLIAFIKERKYLVIAAVILLVIAVTLTLFAKSKKSLVSQKAICDSSTCANGCCVKGMCLSKDYSYAGYTCSGQLDGQSSWMSPEGTSVVTLPSDVMDQFEEDVLPTLEAQQATGTPTEDTTTGQLTNLQIAEKVTSCLNNMRDERGIYLFSRVCANDSKQCEDNSANNTGVAPIWALVKYYEKTKDNKTLETIKNDLDRYNSQIPDIQTDYWNCQFASEAVKSDLLPDDMKEKFRNICLAKSWYMPSLTDLAGKTQISSDTDQPKMINFLLRDETKDILAKLVVEEEIDLISFYVSDFSARYLLTKDKADWEKAKFFFDQAMALWVKNSSTIRLRDACILGEAGADMYKVASEIQSGDFDSYLKFAVSVYGRKGINSMVGSFDFRDKVYCGYLSQSLYDLTKKQEYLKARDEILNSLLESNFDATGYKDELINDGCFNRETITGKISKPTRENSIISYLFSQKL
ncbi:hypothetical protein A2Y99_03540 [Candidatus Gottesmanbacteria bacterium RBG_13_37_7]|uniref:Uncharacterized protein n=1 Tax=Candidatus Gottesmanbacteria bacterium RBG_13_37_7 TaxID=1798369 RepID=A0A1F5YJA1_9BACT|nr:MAG: hypothetical protein A2Y99_03540 [Candidatus Gottesmanbacteria bacterium RBG_13_37_7]